jgi:hypothetical protein
MPVDLSVVTGQLETLAKASGMTVPEYLARVAEKFRNMCGVPNAHILPTPRFSRHTGTSDGCHNVDRATWK